MRKAVAVVPGMDMGAAGRSPLLVLAELGVFWAAAVLHVLRILAADELPDPDRVADAGHAAMGVGMVLMVFGLPAEAGRVLAGLLLALAAVYAVRVARRVSMHQEQDAAIGVGQAAMAFMLLAPGHRPAVLTAAAAAVLAVCALVHGRRLVDGRHRVHHAEAGGAGRMLVTVPHVGVLVMTLAMAGMVVSGL